MHAARRSAAATPYWLDAPPTPGLFRVADRGADRRAREPAAAGGRLRARVAGRRFTVRRAVAFKWTDPVRASATGRSRSRPRCRSAPTRACCCSRRSDAEADRRRLTAGAPSVTGRAARRGARGLAGRAGVGCRSRWARRAARRASTFQVRPAPGARAGRAPAQPAPALRRRERAAGASRAAWCASSTPHIPIQTRWSTPRCAWCRCALATGGGAHRLHPRARATRSPPACAASATTSRCSATRRSPPARRALARFDAIVIGVRAFNTSERLRAAHAALMAYVEARRHAGRPVQHQQPPRAADRAARPLAVRHRAGPRHRRDARRSTLRPPKHPALTTPNPIGPRDFEGWVQERGLYFADKWDRALRDAAGDARPGRAAARGQPALGAPRQGDVRLHRARVLPAAAGRRARAPTACSPTCSRAGRRHGQ